ncbi:MAG: MBL fold metallo-hydrolase [Chloroflexota bacterium]
MKHTQHGNYLHKLTKLIGFNNYLVEEEDGLTLIDTNFGDNTADIIAVCQTIGKPVKRLVVTHAHADHAGAVDEFLSTVPDVEFIASERSASFLAGDMSLKSGETPNQLNGSYVTVKAVPTSTVSDGDMIGSLQVICSAGHTPGHIALLDTRDQTLIAGDAFVTQAGISVSGVFRLLFPFPAMATWNKTVALTSARKLSALNPSRLAVGHGAVLENPKTSMEQAIDEASRKFA